MVLKTIELGLLEPPGGGGPLPFRTQLGTARADGPGDLGDCGLGPFSLQAGQVLVLAEVHDQANSTGGTTAAWAGNALVEQAFGNWGSGSDFALSVWSLMVPGDATGSILLTLGNPVANSILLIATAYRQVVSATIDLTKSFDGAGGIPDSGFSPPISQPDELLVGYVGLESATDPTGAWADAMISGQKVFTTNVLLNLYESYRTVNLIAPYRARKVDAVAVPWEARILAFRM